MKKLFYNLFKNRKLKNNFVKLFEWLLSALVGYLLSLFLNDFVAFVIGCILLIIIIFLFSFLLADKKHNQDIISIMKEQYKDESYLDIIRLGYPLSRPLWISGAYYQRVEVGFLVYQATTKIDLDTIKINDESIKVSKIMASTLIDDLGWTYHAIEQDRIAVNNINEGIRICEKHGYMNLLIKGYRHLCGIYSTMGENEKFIQCDAKLKELINKLEDNQKKTQLYAGYLFARAEYLCNNMEYEESIKHVTESKDIYELLSDHERVAKTYYILAKCHLGLIESGVESNIVYVEGLINQGLESSLKSSRKEEYVKYCILYFELTIKKMYIIEKFNQIDLINIEDQISALYSKAYEICIDNNSILKKKVVLSYKNLKKNLKQAWRKL